MIVNSEDFITKLEKIGGNPKMLSDLADIFISDQIPEDQKNISINTFPNDGVKIKDYTPFFRIDLAQDNLSIFMVRDLSEVDFESETNYVYSDFYEVITKLAH